MNLHLPSVFSSKDINILMKSWKLFDYFGTGVTLTDDAAAAHCFGCVALVVDLARLSGRSLRLRPSLPRNQFILNPADVKIEKRSPTATLWHRGLSILSEDIVRAVGYLFASD